MLPEIAVPTGITQNDSINKVLPNDTDSANESTVLSISGIVLMKANANAEDFGNRGHRHRTELKLFGPV